MVGLAQIADAKHLYTRRGVASNATLGFSLVELFWGLVSAYVAFTIHSEASTALWYPMLFVIYIIISTVWGGVVAKDIDLDEEFTMPVMSPTVVMFGLSFGLVFTLSGIFLALFSL